MTTFADPATDTRLVPPANVLRGPTHADNYRIKVGRYSDRWYTDPLPADAAIPATPDDEAYPSVSIVKKASGNDWTYVGLKRVALADDLATIAQGGFFERYEKLKVINSLGLSSASRRGSNVHTWAESRAYGQRPPLTECDEGSTFFGTVDRIWSDLQPELYAAELPCFHRHLNEVGYGGTSDGIFVIDGKRYIVDWKSRGDDSDHGAYPEEAAQLGAYGRCEYIIMEDPDPANPHGARRAPMPELDGGLIISIKSDSYEVYPVDLDRAFVHFTALHSWWVARRDERKAVGRKWAPRRVAGVAVAADTAVSDPSEHRPPTGYVASDAANESDDLTPLLEASIEHVNTMRREALYARFDKMTDEQQGDFIARRGAIDATDLDAVEQLLDNIEHPPTMLEASWRRTARDRQRDFDRQAAEEADRPLADGDACTCDKHPTGCLLHPMGEGGPPNEADVNEFTVRWELAMNDDARAWVALVVNTATDGNADFRLSTMRSQRRANIYCALTEWMSVEGVARDMERDDELFRAALNTVTGRDDDLASLGLMVGALSTSQAAALRQLVSNIAAGQARFLPDATTPRWALLQDITSES